MSRVLKQAMTDAAVRPLQAAWEAARAAPVDVPAPAVDPEWLRLHDENEWLRKQVAQQAAEMVDLRKQVDAALRDGEAKGREAGRREADDDSARRLAKLESGIEWAIQTFTQSLSALERLAPEIARQGLAGILGASPDRAEWVTGIVRQQLAKIESHAVIMVEVAASDFSDDAALADLSRVLNGTLVQAAATLKSGDCRIRLKLGTLDVGVDQQWGRMEAVLADMSEPGGERRD